MSTPEGDPAETIEIGEPITPRTARRLVAGSIVVIVLAASAVGTVQVRDHLQTVAVERVAASTAAVQSGLSRSRFLQQRVDEAAGGLRSDPERCGALLNLSPKSPAVAGSLLLFEDSSGQPLEVEAVVYTTPLAARSAVRSLRGLIPECEQIAVLSRQEGDAGVRLATTETKVSCWSRLDESRSGYQLLSQDVNAFPDTTVQVRRFGNVVLVSSGPPADTVETSAVVGDLAARLR